MKVYDEFANTLDGLIDIMDNSIQKTRNMAFSFNNELRKRNIDPDKVFDETEPFGFEWDIVFGCTDLLKNLSLSISALKSLKEEHIKRYCTPDDSEDPLECATEEPNNTYDEEAEEYISTEKENERNDTIVKVAEKSVPELCDRHKVIDYCSILIETIVNLNCLLLGDSNRAIESLLSNTTASFFSKYCDKRAYILKPHADIEDIFINLYNSMEEYGVAPEKRLLDTFSIGYAMGYHVGDGSITLHEEMSSDEEWEYHHFPVKHHYRDPDDYVSEEIDDHEPYEPEQSIWYDIDEESDDRMPF